MSTHFFHILVVIMCSPGAPPIPACVLALEPPRWAGLPSPLGFRDPPHGRYGTDVGVAEVVDISIEIVKLGISRLIMEKLIAQASPGLCYSIWID